LAVHPKSRIEPSVGFGDVRRPVLGAIIDDDRLPAPVRLLDQGIERPANGRLSVVRGNDNRDHWQLALQGRAHRSESTGARPTCCAPGAPLSGNDGSLLGAPTSGGAAWREAGAELTG